MSDPVIDDDEGAPTMASGLRTARELLGLSQRELAARVKVSPSMISQIEAGQSQPSVNTLYAIVTELDISMDELFGHRPGSVPEGRLVPAARTGSQPRPSAGSESSAGPRSSAGPPSSAGSQAGSDTAASGPPTGSVLRRIPGAMARVPVVVSPPERSRLRLDTGVTWERLASPDSEALDFMEVVYDVGGTSSRDGTMMRHNSVEVAVLLSGSLEVQVGFDVHHLEAGDSIAFDSTVPHRLWNPGTVPARAVWLVLAH